MLKKLTLSALIASCGIIAAAENGTATNQSIKTQAVDFIKGFAWGATHGLSNGLTKKLILRLNAKPGSPASFLKSNNTFRIIDAATLWGFGRLSGTMSLEGNKRIQRELDGTCREIVSIKPKIEGTTSNLVGHAIGQTIAEGLVRDGRFAVSLNAHYLLSLISSLIN